MLIRIFLNYIFGYVRIAIEGYYIERFINICTNKKIIIWNLKREGGIKLFFNTGINEFSELCKIAKKTQCKIKIQDKKGIPFILHRYKKRKIFVGFLVAIIIIIAISSNFIWNIQIEVQDNEEFDQIEEDLEEVGLKIGKAKSDIDTKEIINKLRLKRDDIAWVGMELKGTNMIVKLVKADAKPEIVDDAEYCNIISDKEGIITKINVQNGTANVKVGDTVKEGTILVNGWMEGKYTGVRYVHAKAEIEAKIWHTKKIIIPYTITETTETGEKENNYGVKINNFEINFPKGVSKFEFYDTIKEEKKFKLFSDFYLPISIVKETRKETKKEQKEYTVEEAKNLGIQQLEEQFDKEIQDKSKIVNKNINTYEKQDEIEIEVTYEVFETIGTNEKIVF